MGARSTFRILHCLRAPVGGLFRHVCDLATAQQSAGHEVAVVCASSGDALTEQRLGDLERRISLGVHRMASGRDVGLTDVLATRRVSALARALDARILHGHGAKGGAYARLAARGTDRLAIYTPHGGSLHYAPSTWKGRVIAAVERRLERATSGLIFESAYSAARYATQIGSPRVPQRVIANGLRPDEFDAVTPLDDATDVLFVGELRQLKGVDVLLKALALVNASRRTTATIVGSGPDQARFQALTKDLQLGERVRFTGAMPARDAFKMGRIMVMPSRAESFPYIVLEAGAAALPLIATRVGGIPEIVGEAGLPLLEPDNAEALAALLLVVLEDETQAKVQARVLQQRIAHRFSVARMSEDVLAFYEDVAALAGADHGGGRLAVAAE